MASPVRCTATVGVPFSHQQPPMLIDHPVRSPASPAPPTFDVDVVDRRCRLAVCTLGLQPRQDLASLAARIGVAEGELLAAHGGVFDRRESPLKTRRLSADWAELLGTFDRLGRRRLQVGNGTVSLAIEAEDGPTPPLRPADLQPAAWCDGYAVEERFASGNVRRSLRFVDQQGRAVLTLTLLDRARLSAFYDLVERFGALALRAPGRARAACPPIGRAVGAPTAALARSWREQWASLRESEGSDGLVQALGETRLRVLRGLGTDLAQPLSAGALHDTLARAQAGAEPLAASVANAGARLRAAWLPRRVGCERDIVVARGQNVRLRVHEAAVAEAWCVRLPGRTGLVHAVECFDSQGQLALRLRGAPREGRGESCGWRHLVQGLLAEAAP